MNFLKLLAFVFISNVSHASVTLNHFFEKLDGGWVGEGVLWTETGEKEFSVTAEGRWSSWDLHFNFELEKKINLQRLTAYETLFLSTTDESRLYEGDAGLGREIEVDVLNRDELRYRYRIVRMLPRRTYAVEVTWKIESNEQLEFTRTVRYREDLIEREVFRLKSL